MTRCGIVPTGVAIEFSATTRGLHVEGEPHRAPPLERLHKLPQEREVLTHRRRGDAPVGVRPVGVRLSWPVMDGNLPDRRVRLRPFEFLAAQTTFHGEVLP